MCLHDQHTHSIEESYIQKETKHKKMDTRKNSHSDYTINAFLLMLCTVSNWSV
jgi:hypothetical protein